MDFTLYSTYHIENKLLTLKNSKVWVKYVCETLPFLYQNEFYYFNYQHLIVSKG